MPRPETRQKLVGVVDTPLGKFALVKVCTYVASILKS